MVLAAAASAADTAASTTTALAFLRLIAYRTGTKFPPGYSMCTYVIHGFSYCHVSSLLLHPAMQQECVPWLVLVDLDGRHST